MPQQVRSVAAVPLVGRGRQIAQLALVSGLVHSYHRLGDRLTVHHQHIQLAVGKIAADHLLAGISQQHQRHIGLFARGDFADLPRRQLARAPVPAAQRHIALVAAQHDLLALARDLAVYHARIAYGLTPAPANGFDLLDRIRPRHQPGAALEQIALEIRAQAIADDRNVHIVHDLHQPPHLFLFQELRLIHDHAVVARQIHRIELFHINAGRAQPAARADQAFAVALVQLRLDHQRVLTALVVIILYHDGVGGFG